MGYSSPLSRRIFPILCILTWVLVACGGDSRSAKTWEVASDGIFSAAISNRFLLAGSARGEAILWDLKANKPLQSWKHANKSAEQGIVAVAISANERYAITAQPDALVWWRIRDGKIMGSWQFPGLNSVKLSRDGKFALLGLKGGAVYFSLSRGKTKFQLPHQGPVIATDLSLTGRYALTGSRDRTAGLWRLSDGRRMHLWRHDNPVVSVAIDPRGRFALTNEALGKTRLWSVKSGAAKGTLGPDMMTLSAARFSRNGKFVATARTSQRIDLWSLRSGNDLKVWRPKQSSDWRPSATSILALSFTKTGAGLLSASANGYVQLWKMR